MSEKTDELQEILNMIGETEVNAVVRINLTLGAETVPGPVIDDSEKPPPFNTKTRLVVPRENGSFPVYRTPTTEEIRKIRLVLMPDSQVIEGTPPKVIHRTPVWETEADLHNVLRTWAWLPRQMVIKNNGKAFTLPNGFIPEGPDEPIWQGCFVQREFLLGGP